MEESKSGNEHSQSFSELAQKKGSSSPHSGHSMERNRRQAAKMYERSDYLDQVLQAKGKICQKTSSDPTIELENEILSLSNEDNSSSYESDDYSYGDEEGISHTPRRASSKRMHNSKKNSPQSPKHYHYLGSPTGKTFYVDEFDDVRKLHRKHLHSPLENHQCDGLKPSASTPSDIKIQLEILDNDSDDENAENEYKIETMNNKDAEIKIEQDDKENEENILQQADPIQEPFPKARENHQIELEVPFSPSRQRRRKHHKHDYHQNDQSDYSYDSGDQSP